MDRARWKTTARLAASGMAALLIALSVARADDKDVRELRERMEKLEAQNKELRQTVESLKVEKPAPAETPSFLNPDAGLIVTTSAEDAKKGDDKKNDWLEVGKSIGLHGVWFDHQPWFETDDKSFRFHVGGRAHLDSVWGNATDQVQFGKGGIGKVEDAVNWRRVRLTMDGWIYEVFDFILEVDFTQTVNDDPTLPANAFTNVIAGPSITEAYAGINYIPWIGTVRIGNQKPPILLEHLTSSRFLDFLERSSLFDTYFNRSNGFLPGIEMNNWTENERLTWQVGAFKNAQTIQPFSVGDGDYQANARVTGLPWYKDEGRYMVHLGLGAQYAEPDHATAILRDRWLLRNGPPTTQNTVALATLNGHDQFIAVPEFFMNLGPWSVQAEYLAHHMQNISSFATQSQGAVTVKGPHLDYFSQGAYVELMYFLTGENRPFQRTGLHSGGARPSRVVPYRNFFWVPGCDCANPFSCGAWQVGARYSYSDMTNNGINGGQINEVTLGLNWFWNPNMKIQWNYDVGYRSQLGAGSLSNGTYQGFGTRLAFDF